MSDTEQFTQAHVQKSFYNKKLTRTKLKNLYASVEKGLTFNDLTDSAQALPGVKELLRSVQNGQFPSDAEASEDLKGLFTESFKYEDAPNALYTIVERYKEKDPEPDETIADEVEALTAQGDELAEQAEKAKTRGKAQQLEKQADEYYKVAEEMLDDTPVEQGGRTKTKRAPAKMTVDEAKKLIPEQRQKEIEQEAREQFDKSKTAEPASAPRARPSASTAEPAPAPAPAPPAPAPAQPPAPAERKRPKESSILDPTPVTSVDLIPNERRSAEFKTAKQLRSDIEFFFESFPDMLEKEMREYIRVNKTSKKELSRFHRKIMGKLQPSESVSPEQKKVGVVISADEYIKQAINKALIDAKMMSMNPADVVELSVKGADKKDDTESYGSYEVKKSKSGKLSAQKEPIYRYVPKVNEEAEREPRSSMLRVKKRETLPQTAKRQVRNNPFLQRQTNSIRLKYLY